MSYPLCVFLDSDKHERLFVDHPFYDFVKETLLHVKKSPLILDYMAKDTLQNEPQSDEAAERRRVREIIQFLRRSPPTVSGSDSPAMGSATLVETRAYSGCGGYRKDRKFARKHIYIQKPLVDAWMKARSEVVPPFSTFQVFPSRSGPYFYLSFLMKLCLLRGLIIAVKTAFMSEDVDMKHETYHSPGSANAPLCSFEHFLLEWNCWLAFWIDFMETRARFDFQRLWDIVFTTSPASLCCTAISYGSADDILLRFYAGEWTAFPPLNNYPYMAINAQVKDVPYTAFYSFSSLMVRIWNSPPAEDPKPRRIETSRWEPYKDDICRVV